MTPPPTGAVTPHGPQQGNAATSAGSITPFSPEIEPNAYQHTQPALTVSIFDNRTNTINQTVGDALDGGGGMKKLEAYYFQLDLTRPDDRERLVRYYVTLVGENDARKCPLTFAVGNDLYHWPRRTAG
jgi:hypothetical protein